MNVDTAASGKLLCEHVSNARLAALRERMRFCKWDAVVIPTGDPHISEYPLGRWASRAWFSGFTGSAGTLAVTLRSAVLWTDGRYEIQSAQQLAGSCIVPMITGHAATPRLSDWLSNHVKRGGLVVCDGRQISAASAERIVERLIERNISLSLRLDPAEGIWIDRPGIPDFPARVHSPEFAGESVRSKLGRIRSVMAANNATHYLISALDAVAWTLNIRGSDIPCTPVVAAFLLVGKKNAECFIDAGKCGTDVVAQLRKAGVTLRPYDDVVAAVKALPESSALWADPDCTSAWLLESVPRTTDLITDADPVEEMKAVKNNVETLALRGRAVLDSAKTARFLAWVDTALAVGEKITELSASAKIEELRSEDKSYLGPSFETIAAYGRHAAIVHYSPSKETSAIIKRRGLFLVDTGGQYPDGTTDITRTISCGPMTLREKRAYTLVLKAHIALASVVFPEGVTGQQLDILARGPLALEGEGYAHGTGHGVGFCLCVHEGPQSIRLGGTGVALKPGMVVTDEPGIYHAGSFGIRTENMLLVIEKFRTAAGRFLAFEPLEKCPIDLRPVIPEMLSPAEIAWLDNYHCETHAKLAPLMRTRSERAWLKKACLPIAKLAASNG